MDSSNRSTITCATVRRVGSGCGAGGTHDAVHEVRHAVGGAASFSTTSHRVDEKRFRNADWNVSTSSVSVSAADTAEGSIPAFSAARSARETLGADTCSVGIFCPKKRFSEKSSFRDAWCKSTSVNADGSSNRSSLVTPSRASAAYHARLVGTKTVNGPVPSNSRSKPAALSASAKKPASRSRRGDESAAAKVGRPGILRRASIRGGGGGVKPEVRCGAGGGMESCGAGPGVPKGGRGGERV